MIPNYIITFLGLFISFSFAQQWVTDISNKYRDSVVGIISYDYYKNPMGSGSGCIVSDDGLVITNHHVIDGASYIDVLFPSSKQYYSAEELYSDQDMDHAILKIDVSNATSLNLSSSEGIERGNEVVAIGTPGGFEWEDTWFANSVLKGSVSNLVPFDYGSWIGFTSPIAKGNSGGPLFNIKGEVVGLVTLGMVGDNSRQSSTLNWATPIDPIKKKISSLSYKHTTNNSDEDIVIGRPKKKNSNSSIIEDEDIIIGRPNRNNEPPNSKNSPGPIKYPGQEIYLNKCTKCHGVDGSGINYKTNLTDGYWVYGSSYSQIVKIVTNGNTKTRKMGWEAFLSPDEIRSVSKYVLLLNEGLD
tara:strand:+ start:717 stop:1787 length:1071 start_codon:yes stop_codon:yes gene_type:complete